MKNSILIFALTLAVSITAQAQTKDCANDATTDKQSAVKVELDQAAAALKEQKFAAAQQHAERALLSDPGNEDAQLHLARALHSQFDEGGGSDTNKAREAIAAYQAAVAKNPGHEEAYQSVVKLYDKLEEPELRYSWILQRALSADIPAEKRADAYVTLARAEFDCSLDLPRFYIVGNDGERNPFYMKPEKPGEFERAQQCASRGMQMVDSAIVLQPENESAWVARSSMLREIAELAKMEGKLADAEEYRKQALENSDRAVEIRRKRNEAELAKAVTIDCGELCDLVISTPKPPYPVIARQARATGAVIVQITIDEQGEVTAAAAVGGHPLLRAAAVQAAKFSRFQPRMVSGNPIPVTGKLTYKFELGQWAPSLEH